METTASTRTQKLIAVGAIVALAILSVQAYTFVATGSLYGAVIHKASGTTDPTSNSTISVTGNGQVNVRPDEALLTIGVNTENASAQAAAQENAKIMNNIIAALGNIGINSSEIQTISYNIYQQNGYPTPISVCSSADSTADCAPICNTPNDIKVCLVGGYEVDNEIQVTVSVSSQAITTLGSKVGAAIDASVAQGANQVYGVQFTASNSVLQQANREALQQAVQDASAQANAIASALGVTVTGVVSVATNPSYMPSPVLYDTAAGASNQTPVVAPQSLTVTASVQAVYAIS
jgi:uncharacterized protein